MGRDQTICGGQLRPGLQVGRLLPGHPGDGGPRPEPPHGARDELSGLCAERGRMRHRAQRPRARGLLLSERSDGVKCSRGLGRQISFAVKIPRGKKSDVSRFQ